MTTPEHFFAPDRYNAGEFIIRSYEPGEGALMNAATRASYDHLKTFMPWARPDQTDEEAEQIVRRMHAEYLRAENFTLGVFSPDEKEVWGGSGFHLREGGLETKNAEIGMWIAGDKAGKGLGTKVLRALIQWAFTEWPWLRLSWRCDPRNAASRRVAEKAGLRLEGTLRSHSLSPTGERRDTACYAILKEEWTMADRLARVQPIDPVRGTLSQGMMRTRPPTSNLDR